MSNHPASSQRPSYRRRLEAAPPVVDAPYASAPLNVLRTLQRRNVRWSDGFLSCLLALGLLACTEQSDVAGPDPVPQPNLAIEPTEGYVTQLTWTADIPGIDRPDFQRERTFTLYPQPSEGTAPDLRGSFAYGDLPFGQSAPPRADVASFELADEALYVTRRSGALLSLSPDLPLDSVPPEMIPPPTGNLRFAAMPMELNAASVSADSVTRGHRTDVVFVTPEAAQRNLRRLMQYEQTESFNGKRVFVVRRGSHILRLVFDTEVGSVTEQALTTTGRDAHRIVRTYSPAGDAWILSTRHTYTTRDDGKEVLVLSEKFDLSPSR